MSPPSRDELREKLAVGAEFARSWVSGVVTRIRELFESRPGLARLTGISAIVVIVVLGLVGIAIGWRGSGGPERSGQVSVPAITSTPRPTERATAPGTSAPPVPGAPPQPGRGAESSAQAPEGGGPPSPSTQPGRPGASAPPAAPAPPPSVPRAPNEGTEHTVLRGETLAMIALRYDVPFEQVAAENGIKNPNKIRAGQRLLVKAKPPGVVVIQPGRTLSDYARSSGRGLDELMRMNPQLTDPNRILAGGRLNV
jgi:LysM repeat protein